MIARIFAAPCQPFTAETAIEDRYQEHTPDLYAGDVFSQTFRLSCGTLESIAIVFSYDQTPTEDSRLLIRLYRNDDLLIEQPLALSACPNGGYLSLSCGGQEFDGDALTVTVSNLSGDAAPPFSLLATTDSVRYADYTDGYTFNGEERDGSIFFRFSYPVYRTEYDFYQKLTKMFLTFLAALLLSGAIGRWAAWRQQRTPRSRG